MKRVLPRMLLALGVVAIVALFLDRGPSLEITPSAISVAPGHAHGAEVLAAGGPEFSPEAARKLGHDSRAPVLEAQREPEVEVSPHAGFWVEVVYADDGSLAVGAKVQANLHVQRDLDSAGRRWDAAPRIRPLETAAPTKMVLPWPEEQVGELLVADAKGRVRMLEPGAGGLLQASADRDGVAYRGELQFYSSDIAHLVTAMRLELFPAFESSVLVLGSQGTPVRGVAVVAFVLEDSKPSADPSAMGTTAGPRIRRVPPPVLAGGVTDPDGRASLFDPSNRVARALESGAPVAVEALALLESPVRAPLVPGEETVLRMPPMGSVAVELAPGPHAQTHEGGRAALSVQGGSPLPFHTLFRLLDGGRTHFAHVGLGLELAAEVQTMDVHGPFRFEGPAEAGQEVRFVLPKPLGVRVVQFQLVDEAGDPISNTWVRVERFASNGWDVATQWTNDAGHLRVECHSSKSTPNRLELYAPGKVREGPWLRTVAALVDLGPGGSLPPDTAFHDAGELVLRPLPVLATGRVLDGSGDPVPGATVAVDDELLDPPASFVPDPRAKWTRSNLRGEFLLEGQIPEPGVLLFAKARGFGFSKPKPLVPGERGVELVLESTGAVRLTLLLPPGLGGHAAWARVVRGSDASVKLDVLPSVGAPALGRMLLERGELQPGTWTLEVLSVEDQVPLWSRDLEVPAAGTADLGEIDLTLRFPTLEVWATGSDGKTLSAVVVRRVDGNRPVGFHSSTSVPILFPKPPDGTMLALSADGFLPLSVAVDGPVLEVVLPPAPAAPLEESGTDDGR